MKLHGIDDPQTLCWLQKKFTSIILSADMQNEMLSVMPLKVLREIATNMFYTVMIDEMTD